MTSTVTLELPETVLIQALRQLPPARRRRLWLSLEADNMTSQHDFETSSTDKTGTLDKAVGLLAVGQSAPTDAEVVQILEERRMEKYG